MRFTNYFVFWVSFIIAIILLIAFELFKPEFTEPTYNFSPFPLIRPRNIPDADIGKQRECTQTIRVCDPGIGCAMCGDEFECTYISPDDNVFVNGNKIPHGTWCLPKGKKEKGCGTYTGRAIWSDRGSQEWECICLYPDLFGGEDCLTKKACIDITSTADQSKNVLVNTQTGHIWDPTVANFNPEGHTPYDKDKQGNPLYKCRCGGGTDTATFVQLPGDPYRCHADPCVPSHDSQMWDAAKEQCDCTSGGKTPSQYAHSNVTGQCLTITKGDINYCAGAGAGIWDDRTNECKCPEDWIVHTCESDTMKRPTYTDSKSCPNNPGGSFCSSPCHPNPCQNGGVCEVHGKGYKCKCRTGFKGNRCEDPCKTAGYCLNVNDDESICCGPTSFSEKCVFGFSNSGKVCD